MPGAGVLVAYSQPPLHCRFQHSTSNSHKSHKTIRNYPGVLVHDQCRGRLGGGRNPGGGSVIVRLTGKKERLEIAERTNMSLGFNALFSREVFT